MHSGMPRSRDTIDDNGLTSYTKSEVETRMRALQRSVDRDSE